MKEDAEPEDLARRPNPHRAETLSEDEIMPQI